MLCLILCPLLARSIPAPRCEAWLALLLAVSPILIFYSRLCRPYSAVAFFSFAALLLAARWMQTGCWRAALGFATTVLAVYFHLFAVVTVDSSAGGDGFSLASPVLAEASRWAAPQPPLRHWLLIAGGMTLAGALLFYLRS